MGTNLTSILGLLGDPGMAREAALMVLKSGALKPFRNANLDKVEARLSAS